MNKKEIKRANRLQAFHGWIKEFTTLSHANEIDFSFIDNAAEILNDIYWTLLDNYVRPLVGDTTNQEESEVTVGRYKIVSATELAIVHVQPIKSDNEEIERRLNALFAYWVGLNVLKVFNPDISEKAFGFVDEYKETIEGVDPKEIQTIQEDHITWLELLDPQLSTPIISNAQTWRLLNLALRALEQKIDFNAKA